jgi:transcriptional regulator with XRE-family HTH domain
MICECGGIVLLWDMIEGLGERVRQFRMSKGWTQPELAAQIGLSRWTVANIESNGRGVSIETLVRFHAVGADLNWLVANAHSSAAPFTFSSGT